TWGGRTMPSAASSRSLSRRTSGPAIERRRPWFRQARAARGCFLRRRAWSSPACRRRRACSARSTRGASWSRCAGRETGRGAAAGGIGEAVRRARAAAHPLLKIEAEVSTPEQIEEALEAGADMLLLDNLGDSQLAAAVKQVRGRVPTEASGSMTLDRLPRVAA